MARVVQGANIDPEVKKTIQAVLDIRSQQIAEGGGGEQPGVPPATGGTAESIPYDLQNLHDSVVACLGLLDGIAHAINESNKMLNEETSLTHAGAFYTELPEDSSEKHSPPPIETTAG